MDLPCLVGEDAGAVGDLLEFVVGVVVVEALGDCASVQIAVKVAPVAAQVGKATIGDRVERRQEREVLATRRVHAHERGAVLAKVVERSRTTIALDPAPVTKLDRHRLELVEDLVKLGEVVATRAKAGRELQEEGAAFAGLGERLRGLAHPPGQLAFQVRIPDEMPTLVELARPAQVGGEGVGLGYVVGEVAVELYVEEKAVRGALCPKLGLALGGHGVEARVQLYAVKALGVIGKALGR